MHRSFTFCLNTKSKSYVPKTKSCIFYIYLKIAILLIWAILKILDFLNLIALATDLGEIFHNSP